MPRCCGPFAEITSAPLRGRSLRAMLIAMRGIIFAAAALLVSIIPAEADAVSSAGLLCRVIDNAGDVVPCKFSARRRTVSATIDVRDKDLRTVCFSMIISLLQQHRITFPGPQWTLLIRTPRSAGKVRVYCPQ